MPLAPGQTVSHYQIVGPIGAGGMGEVYRARDSTLQRDVALKVLPPELAQNPEGLARFEREARVLAALQHPNIVTVHSVERADGVHFLAMELVDGGTLRDTIDQGGLTPERLLPVAQEIAGALHAAHRKGITHRDLKPENVMLTGDGRVKILDFGLAKLAPVTGSLVDFAAQAPSSLTGEGRILGSVAYMSPEQIEGKPVDPRSDVFSLGLLLYELATGTRPFPADNPASSMTAILRDTPPPASSRHPTVPPALDAILQRCLEKDPGRRYQDAGELQEDLKSLQQHRPPSRRNKAMVALLAVMVATALWFVLGGGLSPERNNERSNPFRGPSIAVLPFANESGDPEQDHLSDGLSDEIITALSRYPDLAVIGRTQTRKYKDVAVDVRKLAGELGGVRYVLGGSVRTMGARIKVNAWLSDTNDGHELWSENYLEDLTAGEFFRIQDDLTLKVVNALATGHGELSRAELARAGRTAPGSFDSYVCVLRAYQYWHAHSPENHRVARDCLEEAVQRDRDYPDAWALLAYIYAEEYHHQWNEQPEQYDALERALETAEKALILDSSSQVAHGVMALIHSFMGDRDSFLAEAKTTIKVNPGNADWLAGIGTAYAQLGFYEEGTSLVRQALALNPSPMPWLYMTFFLEDYHHGRYEQALEEASRTETEDFRTPLFRAAAYGQLGNVERAGALLAELGQDPSTDTLEELRELLIRRNGYADELADHLLDGLRKAGMD